MPSKKYPREPLATIRAERTDDATRGLATAIRARETMEKRLRAAEAERERAEASARALRNGERSALERGELTARDLMRVGAWEARAREDQVQLERQLAHARAREVEARAAEVTARADLARRSAEEKVVEKDRARWAGQEQKKSEAKEEEAAAEAWRPKRT